MDASSLTVELLGHQILLLGDRGLYLARRQMLVVADLHLGKETTFQRCGIPVPAGVTAGSLQQLQAMIDRTDANEVVFLGDLFHARSGLSDDVVAAIDVFFAGNRHLRFTLIEGNHDQSVRRIPSDWPLRRGLTKSTRQGITLIHDPDDRAAADQSDAANEAETLFIAGHLHPAATVPGG